MSSPVPVGIDLGTTYSVLAHVNAHGQPEVIANAEGERLTPSVVYLGGDTPLVGMPAKAMQAAGEIEVASFFKRSMGDPSFVLYMGGREWTPIDLSALVLGKLRADGEAFLGAPIRKCVITVPAYFHHSQREATIEAGRRAGLEVLRVINEPTAAALAYGLHKAGSVGTVLVYDLGGGTFDVTLVRITGTEITVLATAGDHNLGGKDWDDRLAVFLAESFAQRQGVNPLEEGAQFNDLLVRAEKAKRDLSARDSTRVPVDHGGKRETVEVSRSKFTELCTDLLERTGLLTADMLAEQKMKWGDLTGVLLVGGSTRMPMVQEYVTRLTGRPPMSGVNVDEAVALGAAVQAALDLEGAVPAAQKRFALPGARKIRDVTAHTLGVIAESADRKKFVNSPIIARNTTVPAQGERDYEVIPRGGQVECIVYVTEGDGADPLSVGVRGKYVCRGKTSQGGPRARLTVKYAYDKNGTIQVSARDAAGGKGLEVVTEPVGELDWLRKSPLELESFDPSKLDLVVTQPLFDDIGSILSTLNLPQRGYMGGPPSGDILFLNCGTPTWPDPNSLRAFVERGGCVYASDLTDAVIAAAFPGVFHFAGHTGSSGARQAEVVDPELRTALGTSLTVHFDLAGWAEMSGVGSDVRVLLRDTQTGRPLMGAAPYGQGKVFYTCFHNHAQANETERSLLQLLVAKQISAVSGVPIEVVTRATGIAIRKKD